MHLGYGKFSSTCEDHPSCTVGISDHAELNGSDLVIKNEN